MSLLYVLPHLFLFCIGTYLVVFVAKQHKCNIQQANLCLESNKVSIVDRDNWHFVAGHKNCLLLVYWESYLCLNPSIYFMLPFLDMNVKMLINKLSRLTSYQTVRGANLWALLCCYRNKVISHAIPWEVSRFLFLRGLLFLGLFIFDSCVKNRKCRFFVLVFT